MEEDVLKNVGYQTISENKLPLYGLQIQWKSMGTGWYSGKKYLVLCSTEECKSHRGSCKYHE